MPLTLWGFSVGAPPGVPVEDDVVGPDGTEISCPLPASQKKPNTGGRDGLGLCVFTSIEYASRWQNERQLWNFQENMRRELGGGWPEKVTQMMTKYAPGVPYIQDTTADLALLREAIRSGRMPCVTYAGMDMHYRSSIAHMVNLVHIDDQWAVISDNNFPRDNQHVWMSISEFEKRWKARGGGWCVILLKAGPPPAPRN